MFIEEIKLGKAEKVFKMRAERRREELAVTVIPYADKKYWTEAEWSFMLDNVVMFLADGFYIRTKLFTWEENPVSEGEKAEEVGKI